MKKYMILAAALFAAVVLNASVPQQESNLTSDEIIPIEKGNTADAAGGTVPAKTATVAINKSAKKTKTEEKATGKKTKKKQAVKETKKAEPTATPDDSKVTELLGKMNTAQAARRAIKAAITIKSDYGEGKTQDITGDIIIKKPDRFYIHYIKPTEQFLVSNAKTLWVYTPDLNQVMKRAPFKVIA